MKIFSAAIAILLSANISWAETARPNIVFIFADDWGWQDLSCHGHPYVKTPNIDRLAKEGTDYHRFTVASGVCSPSRTAIMTGHFPARYNVNGHFATHQSNQSRGMPDWVNPASPSLPRMLRDSGYMTAHFGKWHLSNNMIVDSPSLLEYGYDEYGAFNCSGEQMPYDRDAKRTIEFIEKAHAQEKPFFVNLWIHEPHTPFHVIPKYRQMFPELTDDAQSIYAATLAYADERVGQVLDALDRMNLTENTLVIFSSDNGPAGKPNNKKAPSLMYDSATGAGFDTAAAVGLTGGRKGRKKALHEGGINVPFLARWPLKIKAGTVDKDSLISAVDLLPTFCLIAGASLPEGYQPDGVALSTDFSGMKGKRAKPLFWNYQNNYVVLYNEWKLHFDKSLKPLELYNIVSDHLEEDNVLDANLQVAQELTKVLEGWLATLPEAPTGDVFSSYRKEKVAK